ncbi:hypothetical protein F966_02955, partial [Acinetobacter higginsii]
VHDGIRHLESEYLIKFGTQKVHDGIRHLEKT